MVLKKVLFEVLKTAAMVAQHTDSAGSESSNLATALYKYADGFLSFEQFRKVTLPHSVFQHIHGRTFLYLLVLYQTTAH